MIFVCNKKNMPNIKEHSVVINIMRPSILSNEWSHNPNSAAKYFVDTRKEAIEGYEIDFLKKVSKKGVFRNEVIKIFRLAKTKHVYLMCCCKPSSCHGDVIKKFLLEQLGDEIYQ